MNIIPVHYVPVTHCMYESDTEFRPTEQETKKSEKTLIPIALKEPKMFTTTGKIS